MELIPEATLAPLGQHRQDRLADRTQTNPSKAKDKAGCAVYWEHAWFGSHFNY